MLDPAVLRPGRFDEVIEMTMPDENDRQEIFASASSKQASRKGY